jgi:acetyltransferase
MNIPQHSPLTGDPAQNVLSRPQPLDAFFKPRSVAVIGATETPNSVGRTILTNLLSNPFGGTIYPVNPKRPNVLGVRAYPSIREVPDEIDLAVIVTPAPTVPGVIGQCAAKGVPAAIVISAGFKETGPAGVELERQILEQARASNMRIIGPNCLGVMSPLTGLNATFAGAMAKPGNVAFLSQSGALLTAILDWSLTENVGFSSFLSLGSMLDVGWGDLIDYFGDDPNTQSIVLYMETIGDARGFLSAAREVALAKPIIVIKAGRTQQAAQAAASHTGSLAGSDEVLNAAFERCGVLRVETISDVFSIAEVLGKQPRPQGPRLSILTNAGGPGVLATDTLISEGCELAPISAATMDELNAALPAPWSHGNPIDILGDAGPERYAKAVEIVARDEQTDGLLVILTPQAMTDPTQTARDLRPYANLSDKPVLAAWMGGEVVARGVEALNAANIPTFEYPDAAAKSFTSMWRYSDNLRGLYETPTLPLGEDAPARDTAAQIFDKVLKSGRDLLTESESKQLLAAYGIPIVETRVAANIESAVRAADEIGYPVVLKLHSETITHKTDVGGVKLNLPDAEAVREAFDAIRAAVSQEDFGGVTVQPMIKLDGYELIIGSSLDAQFGPVLLFGSGGQLVEVYKDSALALPPLNTTLARRLMSQTKIHHALHGVRGRAPVDLAALEQLLVRFSQLVVEQPRIKELDINPLIASPERLIALDARVVLHPASVPDEKLPSPVIRPYPAQYVGEARLKDGTPVLIRPIRPEDEPQMSRFHETLSEQSVYQRYLQPLGLSQRVAHERLIRICFNDYDREIALVAERRMDDGTTQILGVGRLIKHRGLQAERAAEFSLVISDDVQRQGLGTELLRRLVEVARAEGLKRLSAETLPDNAGMQAACRKVGFRIEPTHNAERVRLEREV